MSKNLKHVYIYIYTHTQYAKKSFHGPDRY